MVWDLPQPGIELVPPAFGAQYLNCGTTREVPSAHFNFPILNLFILIGEKLLCNIVLVSVIHQNESAHVCPLPPELHFHLPPHPTPLGYHRAPDLSSLHHTANFHFHLPILEMRKPRPPRHTVTGSRLEPRAI